MPARKKAKPPVPAAAPAPVPAAPPKPATVKPIVRETDPIVPRNSEEMIQNVLVRQVADELVTPPPAPPENPVLTAFRGLMDAARDGKPLGETKKMLHRFCMGNQELLQIVSNLRVRYEVDRMLQLQQIQSTLDGFLFRAMDRADLTPAEALVFRASVQKDLACINAYLQHTAKATVPKIDVDQATMHIDYAEHISQEEDATAYNGTTPTGRDVVNKIVGAVRKKLYPQAK